MSDRRPRGIDAPGQARVRLREAGACGTDPEVARFEYGAPPAGEDHLALGHESPGEVVEGGAGVDAIRTGDRAVTMVRRARGDGGATESVGQIGPAQPGQRSRAGTSA